MSAITFAIIATVGWALTPIAINKGLLIIPDYEEAQTLAWLLGGALCCGTLLSVGFAATIGFDISQVMRIDAIGSRYALLAGLFLFPVHNGIYYISSHAYERSEVTLQFEQLSPLLTVPLGFIAGEAITSVRLIAFILVSAGTAYMFWITVRSKLGIRPFVLGMIFMVSGSIGGFFAKLATLYVDPLSAIVQALVAGAVSQLLIAGVWSVRAEAFNMQFWQYLRPFIVHGVLSFGIAYPAYFYSIRVIGLSSTSLIVVSSPIVALIIIIPVRYMYEDTFLNKPSTISDRSLLTASFVVFAGSLLIALPL